MGLRIQHNIAAMNAHRQLQISDAGLSKSLERLSSGYRINRAADDAAGLAISQALRADIASFKVASRNTTEASALLQVAEGAMDQIGSMLTRLKELATQAASANAGSNVGKINAEGNALIDEIDRIANSTEYADVALINGSFGVGISTGSSASVAAGVGVNGATGMQALETYNISFDTGTAGGKIDVTITTSAGSQTINDVVVPGAGVTTETTFSAFGLTIKWDNGLTSTTADSTLIGTDEGNSTFQVGAENDINNRIVVSLGDATAGTLGLAKDLLDNATDAQAFLDTVDTAIATLGDTRGDIGAYMNRLGYAAANLTATIENVQAAESVIRDVDMAGEMTTFTKNQILLQAGTAMLAQANMAPQVVLQLMG
jgi:flagellin